MSKKRDERKRERHIERRRLNQEAMIPQRQKRRQKKNPVKHKERKTNGYKQSSKRSSVAEPLDEYTEKISSMRSDLSSLTFRVGNFHQPITRLDNNIAELSERIHHLQSNRISHLDPIEETGTDLFETWKNIKNTIEQSSFDQRESFQNRHQVLESSVIKSNSLNELTRLSYTLSELRRDVNIAENRLSSQLDEYQTKYNQIDRELKSAELTLKNLEGTSIEWKLGEHPILAVEVKDLTNEANGVLTLSNQRILFEKVSEEVIKRNFLFATEKKIVHTVTLNEPIGSIDVIEKGRVGFLKGAGLFIRFKKQSGIAELKIDTSGNEDTRIIQVYNYIISGEADQDIDVEEISEENGIVACPTCSAPYQEEILFGQTSVKCIYCGTVIKV